MQKTTKSEILLQVIVIKSDDTGLVFDTIDSSGFIKKFELDIEQVRDGLQQYRCGTERSLITKVIHDHVESIMPYGANYQVRLMFR